jgi:hypothetical protein
VRFEGEETEDEDDPIFETGNRWYYFVPLLLVGLWVVFGAAQLVALLLAPSGFGGGVQEPADVVHDALAAMDWLGGLGWVLLFPFYLLVMANKRASSWWLLGAFCCGVNLPLYIALLFQPARRRLMVAPAPPKLPPFAGETSPQPSAFGLKDSFVCESCDSLLNLGVSECLECGQRYRYEDGNPLADDSMPRRR